MFFNNAGAAGYKMGKESTMKVRTVGYIGGVSKMVGETVSGVRKQIMVLAERRKVQDLLDTKDLKLTGLGKVDAAGRWRGLRSDRVFVRWVSIFLYSLLKF